MTELATLPDAADPGAPPARPGPLGRLARVMYRRRGPTVLAWAVALVASVELATFFGGDFKADYTAPGSDSKQAQELLAQRFPSQSGETLNVVVRADGGVAGAKADVQAL